MNPRYLIIELGEGVYRSDISKEDLGKLKTGIYEAVFDLQEGKYFDAEFNIWKDIRRI
jgi:hypothetical protein